MSYLEADLKRLSEVGELMGIKVMDHVIIGDDYFSFVDQEMMPVNQDL